jgi:hypothetical protein
MNPGTFAVQKSIFEFWNRELKKSRPPILLSVSSSHSRDDATSARRAYLLVEPVELSTSSGLNFLNDVLFDSHFFPQALQRAEDLHLWILACEGMGHLELLMLARLGTMGTPRMSVHPGSANELRRHGVSVGSMFQIGISQASHAQLK